MTDLVPPTQRLMETVRMQTGASKVAGEVLRAVHSEVGTIDYRALIRSLDDHNSRAALELITAGLEGRVPFEGLPLSDEDREILWSAVA